jgi:hypothetical protein
MVSTTARDFSVMPVQVAGEPTAIARAVRSRGSLRPGSYVEVEFGAAWATARGMPYKVAGQWRQCVIVCVVSSELHVRLAPSALTAPPAFG